MSPPERSGSAPRFALADDTSGQTWLDKAARGELVTAAERNAAVWQMGAAMDALVDPSIIRAAAAGDAAQVEARSIALPRTRYHGPVAAWHGRDVPMVGSLQPPASWFGKGDGSRKTSGATGGGAKPRTWADIIGPTEAERRRLWLSAAATLQRLQGTGTVVAVERRAGDAGAVPVVAIVVACVALVAWGLYLYEQSQVVRIREDAATARQAAEDQAALQEWMTRAQWSATHPGQPAPPPGPHEARVATRPQPAANNGNAGPDGPTDFLNGLRDSVVRLVYVGGVALLVVTAGPPVVANLADRVTRPRPARESALAG